MVGRALLEEGIGFRLLHCGPSPIVANVDATGVYVAGDTNGTLPGQSSAGGLDVYLRKFLTSGSVAWTSQFGTGGTDYGFMTAVDATGVYVTGFASGKLAGRPYAGSGDAFVRR